MKPGLTYIELKTGHSESGIAWIGRPEVSKTGRTIYFNGMALKANRIAGGPGNYHDIETGEIYWVSRVKKNESDRHKSGSGEILIDTQVVDDYLEFINSENLDKSKFRIVDITPTDKSKFVQLENSKLNEDNLEEKRTIKYN
jgi:hypothetical protein